ncbi:MAG: hypothetical protein AAF797_17180, partial [Planctomycetota bacterium]
GEGGASGQGGDGGDGGSGGAGSGGTVKLVGSVVAGAGAVDAGGGSGGSPQRDGGNGRLILGNNVVDGPALSVVGDIFQTTGPTNTNPFFGGIQTPVIAEQNVAFDNVDDAAEAFGLAENLSAGDFPAILAAGPPVTIGDGAGVRGLAVARLDDRVLLGSDYAGFDALAVLLSPLFEGGLEDVMLGGSQDAGTLSLSPLLSGGFSTRAEFGGTGPLVDASLLPGDVYVTLVPEDFEVFEISFNSRNGEAVSSFQETFVLSGPGDVFYSLPEPGTVTLLMAGVVVLARTRWRPSHD